MAQQQSVGLLILTKLPELGVVAILQARGTFNHERIAPANFPGICQVTCHGDVQVDKQERLIPALEREWGEESGRRLSDVAPYFRSKMVELARVDTPDKLVVTYGLYIENPEFLDFLKLNASTGGIRPLTREGVGSILQVEPALHKTRGVPDQRTNAMFSDEIEAVRKAFDILAPDAGAEAP